MTAFDLGGVRRLIVGNQPTTSIQIASDRVTGVTVGNGLSNKVTAIVTEPLPSGVVIPTANAANIVDRDAVGVVLSRVLRDLPRSPTRVALVLPDSAAKVSLMSFEELPTRASDLEDLVRWQARKTAPFPIEDAQIGYSTGLVTGEGRRELVVSFIRRDIVEEYEGVCENAGVHPGVVDLASFNLVNAAFMVGSTEKADWLLVHVANDYSTIIIVRDGRLVLFRNRSYGGNEGFPDLLHQTVMYYEDRLDGVGFKRAFLATSALSIGREQVADLRRLIELRLEIGVEAISLGDSRSCLSGVEESLTDLAVAPLGLLLRDRWALAGTRATDS